MLSDKQIEFLNSIYKKNTKSLGNTLKFLRIANGLTQQELADSLGTCRQHVQKWEYNIAKPKPGRLKQILDSFYQYNLEYLDLIKEYYL